MDRFRIESWVEKHEGRKQVVYLDSRAHPTIGVGFNLDRPDARAICDVYHLDYDALRNGSASLTEAEIDYLFNDDLNNAILTARHEVTTFDELPDKAQTVVVDMIFNLGAAGFAKFHNLISALHAGDYRQAAEEIRDSVWCEQVCIRCTDNYQLMKECA